jgi:hypothetical protein
MNLHKVNNRTIEIFYYTQKQCDDYNGFHGLKEGVDRLLNPGYYFDNMNGPYATEKAALAAAQQFYS